ncbi:hypothetical protein GS500_23575 [Rhodococcus hoagii]|nr:hypothetical protein [Prescottella equi]
MRGPWAGVGLLEQCFPDLGGHLAVERGEVEVVEFLRIDTAVDGEVAGGLNAPLAFEFGEVLGGLLRLFSVAWLVHLNR